jgi:hypothetical protein
VPGEVGQGHGDEAGALGWPGAWLRRQHKPAGVLAVAEGAQLDFLLRESGLVDRVVMAAASLVR